MSHLVFLTIATLMGVASCAPQIYPYGEDYDHNPAYRFSYGVEEPLTGDFKRQEETRQGDSVRGSYSLIEPDGSHRQVDYMANDATGFNAVVTKNGSPVGTQRSLTAPLYNAPPVYRSGVLYNSAYPHVTAYHHPLAYNNYPY